MANLFSTNLPLQLTSFIGRQREIADVKRLLGTTRLLTLTGAGGCGKTRLALHVAENLLDAFPDGVWFVDLAPLSDPTLISQTIASIFDLHESAETTAINLLKNYLHIKNLLIVLDNCEHLIAACAQLSDTLLRACPDLKILATSREALNIAGEISFRVPSLTLTDLQNLPPVETLAHYESIQLFGERASAANHDFQLTQTNAPSVAQICQHLDGMPLAIELAAVRVKALSVEEIAARLDDRFRLLTTGSRTAPTRQQTLRAAIDWSYALLSEPEQILLRRLSVFAGGWTLEAAKAVCSGEGIDAKSVLGLQSQLVDKSMAMAEERGGTSRYRMLETIRQYAQEKSQECEDGEKIRNHHLHYFLKITEEVEPKLTSAERYAWRARLEADNDNLRAALDWSQKLDDGETELRLAGALAEFWCFNYESEGRQWVEHALARAQTFKPKPAVYAKLLFGAARLSKDAPLEKTRAQLAESVALFKELGDKRCAVSALARLGAATAWEGDFPKARALLKESVTMAHESGEPWLYLMSLSTLGDIFQHWDYLEARPVLEESAALARELGDQRMLAEVLMYSSELDLTRGDYQEARVLREEALSLFREFGNKNNVAWALAGLGEIARLEADYERAKSLYEESLALFREIGSKDNIAWSLHNLGAVAQYRGEFLSAAELFKESLVLRKETGEKEGFTEALAGLAGMAAEMGQPLRAARLFGAAEQIRDGIGLFIRPYNRAPYDRYLPIARAQLDEATFNAAWAKGRAMTLEQVIEYALTDTMPPPDVTLPTDAHPPSRAAKQAFGGLTARERQIATLIAQGKSNRAIADELVVSVKTVEAHITRILDKLGFASRAQIAGWAISKGLADAPQDLDTQIRES